MKSAVYRKQKRKKSLGLLSIKSPAAERNLARVAAKQRAWFRPAVKRKTAPANPVWHAKTAKTNVLRFPTPAHRLEQA